MAQKSKEEKAIKFAELPAHQIDASVFIEILRNQPLRNECRSYLYNYGMSYRLAISIPVLGEVSKFILEFPKREQKAILFDAFERLADEFEIEITSPSFDTYQLTQKISSIDNRMESMDCLNYACAVSSRAETFVTADTHFDKRLENEFGVKIKLISSL